MIHVHNFSELRVMKASFRYRYVWLHGIWVGQTYLQGQEGPEPHGFGVFIDTDNMNLFSGRFDGTQIVHKSPNIRVTLKSSDLRLPNRDGKEYFMHF